MTSKPIDGAANANQLKVDDLGIKISGIPHFVP
jgi:hypothetical protein